MAATYYILEVVEGCSISSHGPFTSDQERDDTAQKLARENGEAALLSGAVVLFWLDIGADPARPLGHPDEVTTGAFINDWFEAESCPNCGSIDCCDDCGEDQGPPHQCPGTDEDDKPLQPDAATCGICGRSWCDRCDPAPSALCHFCHGRGESSAPLFLED